MRTWKLEIFFGLIAVIPCSAFGMGKHASPSETFPFDNPALHSFPTYRLGVGDDSACAILNGSVKCWGNNNSPLVKEAPQSISNPSAISVGGSAACVLAGGKVTCWGTPKLILPTVKTSLFHKEPVTDVTSLTVMPDGICVVSSSQGYLCSAGAGGASRLGDVVSVAYATEQVSGGGEISVSCKINDNRALDCDGVNEFDQTRVPPDVVNVDEIVFGPTTACARMGEVVHCWGKKNPNSTMPDEPWDIFADLGDSLSTGCVDLNGTYLIPNYPGPPVPEKLIQTGCTSLTNLIEFSVGGFSDASATPLELPSNGFQIDGQLHPVANSSGFYGYAAFSAKNKITVRYIVSFDHSIFEITFSKDEDGNLVMDQYSENAKECTKRLAAERGTPLEEMQEFFKSTYTFFKPSPVADPASAAVPASFQAHAKSSEATKTNDGTLWVVGISPDADGTLLLSKYLTNGTVDTSFNQDKVLSVHLGLAEKQNIDLPFVQAIDGQIYIAAEIGPWQSRQLLLLRLNSDGGLDPSFGKGGAVITDSFSAPTLTIKTENIYKVNSGNIYVVGKNTVETLDDFQQFSVKFSQSGVIPVAK
jgi:hypothetical protein